MNLFVGPIGVLVSYTRGGQNPGSPICGVDHRNFFDWRLVTKRCGKILVNNFDSSRVDFADHGQTRRRNSSTILWWSIVPHFRMVWKCAVISFGTL